MNKTLVITGLAQETDFAQPEKAKTVLVINKGELRIPVDETSVQQILEYALKGYNQDEGGLTSPVSANDIATTEYVRSQANGHSGEDESYPDQDDYAELAAKEEEDDEDPDEEDDEVFDDTGISQL